MYFEEPAAWRRWLHSHHADVDADRFLDEPHVLALPLETFDGFAEALGNDPRVAEMIEVWIEEAELVAAEPRVQLLTDAYVR